MKKASRLLISSMVFCVISMGSFVLGRHALVQIYLGGQDLSQEWRLVNLVVVPIVIFHILSFIASLFAIRFLKKVEWV